MTENPRVYATLEFKSLGGDRWTIGISGVDSSTSREGVRHAMQTLEILKEELALSKALTMGLEAEALNKEFGEDVSTPAKAEVYHLPAASEVKTTINVFGVELPLGAGSGPDSMTPITEGEGGQMTALNTVLSNHGYKNENRHAAVNVLMNVYFAPHWVKINSLKQLTKPVAHLILTWFEKADYQALLNLQVSVYEGQPELFGAEPPAAMTAEDRSAQIALATLENFGKMGADATIPTCEHCFVDGICFDCGAHQNVAAESAPGPEPASICKLCNGSGTDSTGLDCRYCEGTGMLIEPCPACSGTGTAYDAFHEPPHFLCERCKVVLSAEQQSVVDRVTEAS